MGSTQRASRHLDWEGCFNARDLGGLRTADGGRTRWRAVVRSDSLDHLTEAGWSALTADGVRTIVDLRNDDEVPPTGPPKRPDLISMRVPLDDIDDDEFWSEWASGPQFGTPLYYRAFLERKPDRAIAVVAAVARAGPGSVVVHCEGGRDRTGLVALILLALVGVVADDIVADYELSYERMRPYYRRLGEPDREPVIREFLHGRNTSIRQAIMATLDGLDLAQHLRSGGLRDDDLAALRARLLPG